MVQVLRLNNTSDILKHNLTFDEVIMTFNARTEPGDYYIDARAGIGNAYLFRYATTNVDQTPLSSPFANGVYVNGVLRTDAQNLQIPTGVKTTLRLLFTASGTDDVNLFSQNNNNNKLPVDIYDIKFLLGGVVKAHLDATKGTANDQSGNGNNFALTGGTWLDDGTGGGGTGTDGTTTFDTKQIAYTDGTLATDLRQLLYADQSLATDTRIAIYQDGASTQDTAQILYEMSSAAFDTLQELFNDGQVGATPFDIRVQLYEDLSARNDTKQAVYDGGLLRYDVAQVIYESNTTVADVKAVIYADSAIKADALQTIYADEDFSADTLQRILSEFSEYGEVVRIVLEITQRRRNALEIMQKHGDTLEIVQRRTIELNL